METKHKSILTEIFYATIKAVDPYESVKSLQQEIGSLCEGEHYNKLIVIGFGKASCNMAKAIEDCFLDLIDTGIVITKYGHYPKDYRLKKIKVHEAAHPIPDKNGIKGTEEIIKLIKDRDKKDLVICLISGGGSALLVSPYDGISLSEKQQITGLLQKAGADINDLNTVRKHLSKVKGGRLAEYIHPARTISLILSDVLGDRLDVIASGPTSPDQTSYADSIEILEKYKLIDKVPLRVLELFEKGVKGLVPDTPKEGDAIFSQVDNIIIGNNKKAIITAKNKAEQLGFETSILSSNIHGEATTIGSWLAEESIKLKQTKKRKVCLVSGGETTVTVKGKGKGGRNMELALAFAEKIKGIKGITLLSSGTDGTDGPTDAAGAIVNGKTVVKADKQGLNIEDYIRNNDSYNFLKQVDELFITGPTGTNVMDIQIILIE